MSEDKLYNRQSRPISCLHKSILVHILCVLITSIESEHARKIEKKQKTTARATVYQAYKVHQQI